MAGSPPTGCDDDGVTHAAAAPNTPATDAPSFSPSRGVWCSSADVDLVMRLSRSGFDWVALDAQHGAVDRSALLALARALDGGPVPFLVRVPAVDAAWVGAALDAGAAAVVVPSVTGLADAQAAVRASHYPPGGERSWGPFPPLWGGTATDPAAANARQQCWVMVETAGALAEVEDVAALPGVDALFVGPFDLALSLGTTVAALLRDTSDGNPLGRVVAAARRHGVLVGAFAGSPEVATLLRAHGIGCLAVTTDTALLAIGAAAVLDATPA